MGARDERGARRPPVEAGVESTSSIFGCDQEQRWSRIRNGLDRTMMNLESGIMPISTASLVMLAKPEMLLMPNAGGSISGSCIVQDPEHLSGNQVRIVS